MKILMLTHVLPYPLDAGPKLRAYYVLRHLAARHTVVLVSFSRSDDAAEGLAHLRHVCHAVHTAPMTRSRMEDARAAATALARRLPVIIARDHSPAMERQLAQVISTYGPFDAVHADQTSMVQYAQWAAHTQRRCHGHAPRLILDAHNALHQVVRRLADQAADPVRRRLLAWEAARLAVYEATSYARFDTVAFVTAEDRAHFDLPNAHVIPICTEPAPLIARRPTGGDPQVLFVGTLFWPPNAQGLLWFLREVWPQVMIHAPGARLVVAGKRPPAALVELAAATPRVTLAGYVEDLTALVAHSDMLVVPLHAGGGMRVKIIDAWRWGLPVVSTTIGAEGLACTAGDQLLVADDAASFAAAVVRILAEPALAARLADAGRRRLAAAYDWRRVYAAWDAIYPTAQPRPSHEPTRELICN